MSESPVLPEFWDVRYTAGRTPWDFGGVPPALTRYLATHPGNGARALVPGCGFGYELEAMARAGYRVTAIDFSSAAVQRARARLVAANVQEVNLHEGDFFAAQFPEAPFDFVYERTFLCALPPELWPKLAHRLATLVKPNGTLAGFYFFGAKDDGPPFGLEAPETHALFGDSFALVDDRALAPGESMPVYGGGERWQEWRRLVPVPGTDKHKLPSRHD